MKKKSYITLFVLFGLYIVNCGILNPESDYLFIVVTVKGVPVENIDFGNSMGDCPLEIKLEDYIFNEKRYKGSVKFDKIGRQQIKEKYSTGYHKGFSVGTSGKLEYVTEIGFDIDEMTHEIAGKKQYIFMKGRFGFYGPGIDSPGNINSFVAAAKRFYEE